MEKRKLQLFGALLIIIPIAVIAAGDISIGEIIWALFSITTGVIVLRSAWLKSSNSIDDSKTGYTKRDIKKIIKWIYIGALIGVILSTITFLQAGLSLPLKLFSVIASLLLIYIITKIILRFTLKKLNDNNS